MSSRLHGKLTRKARRPDSTQKNNMKEKPDRVCYRWDCLKYPQCARAAGKGCSLDWIEENDMIDRTKTVLKEECGKEKNYPFFLKR